MIVYPAEYQPYKEAVFKALAGCGGGRRLRFVGLDFRDWPQTDVRVTEAFLRAKHKPGSVLGARAKRLLLRGQYNWSRRYFAAHPDHVAVAWNGLTGTRYAFLQAAKDAGAPVLYAELAPLPGRITLDPAGVNALNMVPQEPDFYMNWAALHEAGNWRQMGAGLSARPSRRGDVGQQDNALPNTPFLFCPLQVPGDTQITLFADWCQNMAGFLAALQQSVGHLPPDWHLRVKEHPSAKSSLAPLLAPLLATGRVVIDNQTDSFTQIAASRGVVTLNSSMGLQAFFYDRPVITLGQAFFNIQGLVHHATGQAQLDQLFSNADGLAFDGALRTAFMGWLDQVYYPAFQWSADSGAQWDRPVFEQKLRLAHEYAKKRQ